MTRAGKLGVVIAHYDRAGRLARYLAEFVVHLRSLVPDIVFVSTGLGAAGAAKLEPHARVIVRENVGYDFFSYRVGLEALGDLARFERVWILNSSFLILDPARLCEQFLGRQRSEDILGLSKSTDLDWHLQSYCIMFQTPEVIRSPAFSEWWGRLEPISERLEVIRRYEIGMSRHFTRLGFRLGAAFEPDRRQYLMAVLRAIETRYWKIPPEGSGPAWLNPADGERLNPTHFIWEHFLEHYGVVKLDLLRSNTFNVDLRALHGMLSADRRYLSLCEDAL